MAKAHLSASAVSFAVELVYGHIADQQERWPARSTAKGSGGLPHQCVRDRSCMLPDHLPAELGEAKSY